MAERYLEVGWGTGLSPGVVDILARQKGITAEYLWEHSLLPSLTSLYKLVGDEGSIEEFIDQLGAERSYPGRLRQC